MPALNFTVRWPDGSVDNCYSPSTVLHEHLQEKQSYDLEEFVQQARLALNEASERVQKKYGYYCSSSIDQLAQIEHKAQRFLSSPDRKVEILEIR